MNKEKKEKVIKEFSQVINSNSLENESNTPDYILAEYLYQCLLNFNECSAKREEWYGKSLSIGMDIRD